MTKAELAAKAREKWPQYKDVPDDQLADAMVVRFPQYKELLTPAEPAGPIPASDQPSLERPSSSGFGSNLVESAMNVAAGIPTGLIRLASDPANLAKNVVEGITGRLKIYQADIHPRAAMTQLREGRPMSALGNILPMRMAYEDPAGVAADVGAGSAILRGGIRMATGARPVAEAAAMARGPGYAYRRAHGIPEPGKGSTGAPLGPEAEVKSGAAAPTPADHLAGGDEMALFGKPPVNPAARIGRPPRPAVQPPSLTQRVSGNKPITVYHGVAPSHMENIRKYGLLGKELRDELNIGGGGEGIGLSVTTDPNIAGNYGGTILRAEIPRGRLKADRPPEIDETGGEYGDV